MEIINLTNEELCMLEQLAYLSEDVTETAKIKDKLFRMNDLNKGDRIFNILSVFDDKALAKLRSHPEAIDPYKISGVEWANIIEYLKDENNRISQLVLSDIMFNNDNFNTYIEKNIKIEDNENYTKEYISIKNDIITDDLRKKTIENNLQSLVYNKVTGKYFANAKDDEEYPSYQPDDYVPVKIYRLPLALCFVEQEKDENGHEYKRQMLKEHEAIIAYKGTSGADEWADNVKGAYVTETLPQKEALDFANRMVREHNFTELTVTGHSKGANKAMYTTIMCPNVTRCVSFDGQGFSRDFMSDLNNIPKILKRSKLITQYSLSTDFVHILLNQLPGSRQIYCKGYGVDSIGSNHSPNSFFVQETSKVDGNEVVNLKLVNSHPTFTIEEEKTNVTTLKGLIDQIVTHGSVEFLQYVEKWLPLAVKKDKEELNNVLFGDIPHFSELLANLFYYTNKNDLDFYDVIDLMNEFSCSLGIGDAFEPTINWVFYLLKQSVDLDENEKIKYIVYDLLDKENNDSIISDVSAGASFLIFGDIFKLYSKGEIKEDVMDYIINNIKNNVDDNDEPESLKDKALHFFVELSDNLTNPTLKIKENVLNPLVDKFVTSEANSTFDGIIDSCENVINLVKQNFDSIWSEMQKSYAVLKAEDNDLLKIYYSDYISENEKNKEDFKKIFSDNLGSFFNEYPIMFSDSNYNTVDEFVRDYLNDPESAIFGYSNNIMLNRFMKNFINTIIYNAVKELPAKYARSWRIEDSGNNVISDYSSDTVLYTGKGDDLVYTGNESSIILGGEGNDVIIAGEGNDELYGDSGDDYIDAGNGHNYIYGGEDKDSIYGGADIDEIFGGAGDDTIYAGDGEDKIYGGDNTDTIHGGEDRDWIYGDEGEDTIYGDGGNDTIDGGIGNDTLYGNDDNDTLRGREGNDTLNGGFNDDTLRGGDNSDTYHFYKSGGNDNIYDKYGSNTIVFDGVDMSDLSIAYTDTEHQNLLFTIISTNDTLKIIDYKNTADNFKYKFEDDSDYYTIEDNEGVLSFSKIEDNDIGVRYGSHWEEQHDDNENRNSNRYSTATAAQPPRDPLVIDLGTKGINLSTVENGVHFDIDKNGFAEKTVWTDGEDGFLVLDRNYEPLKKSL